MKMEAEIGALQSQAKERLEPPEAGRVRKRSSPEPVEGARLCPLLDFRVPASRTGRE